MRSSRHGRGLWLEKQLSWSGELAANECCEHWPQEAQAVSGVVIVTTSPGRWAWHEYRGWTWSRGWHDTWPQPWSHLSRHKTIQLVSTGDWSHQWLAEEQTAASSSSLLSSVQSAENTGRPIRGQGRCVWTNQSTEAATRNHRTVAKLSSSYHLVYSQKIQHHGHQPQASPWADTQEQWIVVEEIRMKWWVPPRNEARFMLRQIVFSDEALSVRCEEPEERAGDKYEPSRAPSFNTKVTRRICHHLKSKLEQQGSNVSIFSGLILHFKSIPPCWITKSQNYPQ